MLVPYRILDDASSVNHFLEDDALSPENCGIPDFNTERMHINKRAST
jgi:hypothetical protein